MSLAIVAQSGARYARVYWFSMSVQPSGPAPFWVIGQREGSKEIVLLGAYSRREQAASLLKAMQIADAAPYALGKKKGWFRMPPDGEWPWR